MKNKVRHVLGISGGKDSAALAIYLFNKYPQLDIEYYTCDTGKELEATYQLIKNLEIYLGKKIILLEAANKSHEDPFDHFLKLYGGYLPSSGSRWCTRKLKLDPFEKWVGDDPVISYVGIRGDESREGYISKKTNIQSIFPFRKNIWSEDVISKLLKNEQISNMANWYALTGAGKLPRILEIVEEPISGKFTQNEKLDALLDLDTRAFNQMVFEYLKTTHYPLSNCNEFELTDNEEVLIREDIFRVLRDSGVGVPQYYEKVSFEVNGQKGEYARSRSGCYFCFFQQKIEWVWLYEQHPEKFKLAMEYEKDGYTWMQDERLEDIIRPDRIRQIKEDQIKKASKANNKKSSYLIDILDESDGEGCASCFI
ncbi:phosphoadenosine phosphosulfate reductase family protein [Dyadobacter sandarakinus]|uniref:Phosphoadenosine phosphosulfate reductase family protein n=1 Tax=Dyadobacter sandarakinus TaxID=2747268 RepID=A0ABX7I6I7_9BACT|nr:phosphoadenosine phosphosulfate reductase family protein [Dyadobacter sandarakinus]QRR01499.1 phosphoadenosine phosphosulfate reductase family protein [Dyadobacter sandarakinus]